jgi:beta-lactamase class D OXA-50
MRFLANIISIAVLAGSAAASEFNEIAELEKPFRDAGVVGTFVLLDGETLRGWNKARAQQRFVPASTFKIPNSLIALSSGAVKSIDEIVPYGGKPQRLKQWEQDMNLRDAFKASNVPIYKELARRTGLDRMREAVKQFGYGNMEVGDVVDNFWLEGPLAISAIEQVQFLSRLTSGQLPVDEQVVNAVREISIVEKNGSSTLHGKTGWHWPNEGQQIGWWVGWIERDGKTYPFALNIDINSDADAQKRIPIARECLRLLDKL